MEDAVADPERQLWPLIEVVRIYIGSPALSTGAILVDLPGLADANAGRAKIAQEYVQHATKIWIVAPMIRAVDDGTARSLLGDSMKRQLVSDLNFKSITFVCSKTDEIDCTKMQQLPDVKELLQPLLCEEEKFHCTKEKLTKEIKKKTETDLSGEAGRDLAELIDHQGHIEKGIDTIVQERPRKRRRKAELRESTPEQVHAKIATLGVEKDSAGSEVVKLVKLIDKHQYDKVRIAKDLRRNQTAMHFACIQWRNKESTRIIQQQFALGIETYDRDRDADRSVKSQSARDYDALKKELPVFCTSAKAYQSLQKRRGKDASVPGFDHVEQTEVPKLRQQCMSMAEELRLQGYRRFINDLSPFTFRLATGLPRDNITLSVSKPWSTTEESRLKGEVKSLLSMRPAPRRRITVSTVEQWATAVDKKTLGGYPYSVYKAFCRRNGDYKRLEHNWNEALVFRDRVPEALGSLRSIVTRMLSDFHEAQVAQAGSEYPTVIDMEPQIATYIARVEDAVTAFQCSFNANQKEMSRLPVKEIKEAMLPTYKACNHQRGVDSFKRMKKIMRDSIELQKDSLFRKISNSVDVGFQKMLDTSLQELDKKLIHDILSRLDKDYLSVSSGSTSGDVNRPQSSSTDEIANILRDSQEVFKAILDNGGNVHLRGTDLIQSQGLVQKTMPNQTSFVFSSVVRIQHIHPPGQ
ncbi:MAG: hypothetical protein Q9194_006942 [Teloschistes cf. exilis]